MPLAVLSLTNDTVIHVRSVQPGFKGRVRGQRASSHDLGWCLAVYHNWHLTESDSAAPYSRSLTRRLIIEVAASVECEVAALVLHQNPRWVSSGERFVRFHINSQCLDLVCGRWLISWASSALYFQTRFSETRMLSWWFKVIKHHWGWKCSYLHHKQQALFRNTISLRHFLDYSIFKKSRTGPFLWQKKHWPQYLSTCKYTPHTTVIHFYICYYN